MIQKANDPNDPKNQMIQKTTANDPNDPKKANDPKNNSK